MDFSGDRTFFRGSEWLARAAELEAEYQRDATRAARRALAKAADEAAARARFEAWLATASPGQRRALGRP